MTMLGVALAAIVSATISYNSHCSTFDTALKRTSDGQECVGAIDPQGRPEVFGPKLEPVMKLIAEQDAEAMKAGPGSYVTVAFMGPLTSDEPRVVHQLEGAYTAQAKENASGDYPKIRLVVANQGDNETHWDDAVSALLTMVDDPDRLLAVAGLGLSQEESVLATRKLAASGIPVIGDIITADGFNATGTIDGKDPIRGLVQTSPNNTSQLNAEVTDVGSEDYYTKSLAEAFENHPDLKTYLPASGLTFPLDPEDGRKALKTISNTLCGKVLPDMVFYAARQSSLPTFLDLLRHRPCSREPIIVITGSDGAGLRGQDIPALNDPNAPISVVYVPLADPAQLESAGNPYRLGFQTLQGVLHPPLPGRAPGHGVGHQVLRRGDHRGHRHP